MEENKKSEINFRRLIPILTCCIFFTVTINYSIDYPQAFEDALIRKFDISTTKIQAMYTIYCYVNTISAPLQALTMNKFSYGMSLMILSAVSFLGSLLIHLSLFNKSYLLMALGRVIYSLGGEAFFNITMAVINERFIGSFTTVAMTVTYMLGKGISAIANYYQPKMLIDSRTLQLPFFTMVVVGFVQFIFCFWFYSCYNKMSNQERAAHGTSIVKDNEKLNPEDQDRPKFTRAHLKTLNPLFWCALGCYTFIPTVMYTFTFAITDFFMFRFGYEYAQAKNFMGILNGLQSFLMPLSGFFMQIFGYKTVFLLAGSILSVVGVGGMMLQPEEPSIGLWIFFMIFTLYFALYGSAIYPCMSMSVAKDSVSIGLSIATIIQQFLLGTTPLIIGELSKDRTPQAYQNCLYFNFVMALIGLSFSVLTFILDFKTGKILFLPENSAKVSEMRKKLNAEYRKITKEVERFKM